MRPMLALLLAGCNPHDAEVTGTWTVWLAANSSETVDAEIVDLSSASRVDCAYDEDDPRSIGNSDGAPSCDAVDDLGWQTWLQDDGFYSLSDSLEPWRTDAIINGEGDFQLTVHHKLGNGEDFRFAFSIDPDFAPSNCTSDGDGNLKLEYEDGSSWLDKWSEDEDGYTIYYLNAGAYQYDPNNTSNYWSFDSDWLSGIGVAKWSDDDFYSYGVDYSWFDPDYPVYVYCEDARSGDVLLDECIEYDEIDARVQELADGGARTSECQSAADSYNLRLFYRSGYHSTYCENTLGGEGTETYQQAVIEKLEERTAVWAEEMTQVYGADAFEFRIEDNAWREADSTDQGLDGWVDVHTSWVRIKDPSQLKVDGTPEGDFQIYFYGAEANSHLLVRGSFKAEKVREDKWAYEDLDAVKREENGTEYCGGATLEP